MDVAGRTYRVLSELNAFYGPRPWRSHGPAIDELVATILSQHTSDANTARAYAELRRRFPTWEAVIEAPTQAIVDTIKSAGLANVKAPRIQSALAEIKQRYGCLDLSGLEDLSLLDARRKLTELSGVGPKTASCVLLFSLGLPSIPVDTHVHRVARRLGLIAQSVVAGAAHEVLEELVGPNRDDAYAFHMHLIELGRTTCRARRAHCVACPLASLCDYAAERHDAAA